MITIDVALPDGSMIYEAVMIKGNDLQKAMDAVKTLRPEWVRVVIFMERESP